MEEYGGKGRGRKRAVEKKCERTFTAYSQRHMMQPRLSDNAHGRLVSHDTQNIKDYIKATTFRQGQVNIKSTKTIKM